MSRKEIFNDYERNFNSLQNELHFKIGEEYDLNEFNLKFIKSTFKNGLEYENYQYIKKDITSLLEVEFTNSITLQYNTDILSKIIYEFDIKDYESLKSKIEKYTFKEITLEILLKDKNNFQIVITQKDKSGY
ncbi:hypothetical protein [Tenacibaculum sp.]|uniref:hypothetical protein n=1 Tax=Tenacibaculum sp. TaxID=1906242 RepID=UPI003AA858AB